MCACVCRVSQVSDFGLSRVEDDDTHASFPFNSCGTAAYVAPEALICNKKVNSSVDVYAFGILMWEVRYVSVCVFVSQVTPLSDTC